MAWTKRDFRNVRTSTTPPENPTPDMLWFNPVTGDMQRWNGVAWEEYFAPVEELDEEFLDSFQDSVIETQETVEDHLANHPSNGGGGGTGLLSVDTIDELRDINITGLASGTVRAVLGYYEAGDVDTRYYRWITSPPGGSGDDGGEWIKPSMPTSGRWQLIWNKGVAPVTWWGARADARQDDADGLWKTVTGAEPTDSTLPIKNAREALTNGGIVLFPAAPLSNDMYLVRSPANRVISAVDAGTDTITTEDNHDFAQGNEVRFTDMDSGTLPAPLVEDQSYWVAGQGLTNTTFKVCPTNADALIDGNIIDITDAGAGIREVFKSKNPEAPIEMAQGVIFEGVSTKASMIVLADGHNGVNRPCTNVIEYWNPNGVNDWSGIFNCGVRNLGFDGNRPVFGDGDRESSGSRPIKGSTGPNSGNLYAPETGTPNVISLTYDTDPDPADFNRSRGHAIYHMRGGENRIFENIHSTYMAGSLYVHEGKGTPGRIEMARGFWNARYTVERRFGDRVFETTHITADEQIGGILIEGSPGDNVNGSSSGMDVTVIVPKGEGGRKTVSWDGTAEMGLETFVHIKNQRGGAVTVIGGNLFGPEASGGLFGDAAVLLEDDEPYDAANDQPVRPVVTIIGTVTARYINAYKEVFDVNGTPTTVIEEPITDWDAGPVVFTRVNYTTRPMRSPYTELHLPSPTFAADQTLPAVGIVDNSIHKITPVITLPSLIKPPVGMKWIAEVNGVIVSNHANASGNAATGIEVLVTQGTLADPTEPDHADVCGGGYHHTGGYRVPKAFSQVLELINPGAVDRTIDFYIRFANGNASGDHTINSLQTQIGCVLRLVKA